MNAERILADLDRCPHGRHDGDPCFSCPDGLSPGNPYLRPGQTIGFGLDGVPIVVPDRSHKYNPANWYAAATQPTPPTHPCQVERRDDVAAFVTQYLVRCRCHSDAWTTWRPGDKPVVCATSGVQLTPDEG